MDKIIKKFIKQYNIDEGWLFKLRHENDEESGPYSFSHISDLLLGGAITGEEDVAWYPHGEWIPLGSWELFNNLIREFKKEPRVSSGQNENWEKILERFPSPISLPPPIKEEETALIEREEAYVSEARVGKFFIPTDLIRRQTTKILPRLLVVLIAILTSYLIYSSFKEKEWPSRDFVAVQVPSLATETLNEELSEYNLQRAKELMSEYTPIAHKQAVEELLKALLNNPQNGKARLSLAESYMFLWPLTDKSKKTAEKISTLIEQAKNVTGSEATKARLELVLGNLSSAIEIANRSKSTDLSTRLIKSEIFLEEGKPKQSVGLLETILEEDPENVRAHYVHGLALEKLKKQEEALESFGRVLEINPRHGSSTLKIALIQLQSFANVVKAEELLKNVTLFPSFVYPEELSTAHYYLGRIYEERGQVDFAIREYQNSLNANPDDQVSKDALVRLGGENALAKIYKSGERLKGSDYYVSIGNKYLEEGKKIDAIAQFKLAIQVDPNNPTAYYYLGDLYAAEQNYNEAIQQFQQAINRNPQDVKSRIRLGDIFTKSYKYKNAEEVIQKARQLEPNNPQVYITSGNYFEANGEFESARQEFTRGLELDPKSADAEMALGKIYMRIGEYDKAIGHLEKAIKLNLNLEDGYIALAEAIFRKGFQTKAVAFLKQRISKNPLSPVVHRGLGKLYELAGHPDLAINYYQKVIQLKPNDPQGYEDLAELYKSEKRYQDALYYYATAIKLDPNNASTQFNLAYIYYEKGDYVAAVKALQNVVALNDVYPKVHFNLGRIYTLLNYKRQAIDEFKKEIRYNPDLKDTYESHLALGDIYYGIEEFVLAKEQYEAAIKLNPNLTSAYLKLGRTYRSLGQLESAEEIFQALLKIDPNIADAWKDLGDLAAGRENNELAIKAYEEYLLRNPAAVDSEEVKGKIRKLTNIYQPIE